MPDAAKAELLRALGRLVRGLSAVFWGLALMGWVYLEMARVETSDTAWLDAFGRLVFLPALVVSGMLWGGLRQMRAFQPQERIWGRALHRAEALAITDAGLSPFLFWWHRFPSVPYFAASAGLLFLCSICLLIQINCVLRRLSAMLPDETLRAEAKLFTACNITFILAVVAGLGIYCLLSKCPWLSPLAWSLLKAADDGGIWVALFLALLPLAMTMALVWKIREAIFAGLLAAGC